MALLKIIKLAEGVWKHWSDKDGFFALTRLYAKIEENKFLIVEAYGAKRRKYSANEIEVYDIGGSAETFANFDELQIRLKELEYIGYDSQYSGGTNDPTKVPLFRTLTFNGVTLDLSANRSWTIVDNSKVPLTRTVTINGDTQTLEDNVEFTVSAGGSQDLDETLTNGNTSNQAIILNAITNVPKTIVWVGDSIIQGTGPTSLSKRYSTLTCNALNYTEDNRAISGSTLAGASYTLIPTKTSTLQYLVIGYGTNDIGAGRTSTQFQTDLTNFVDNAISKGWAGSDIVIVSLPGYQYQTGSGNTTKVAFNTAMSTVATAKGCTYVDFYSSMITGTPFGPVTNLFLTTDGTHPNDLGSIVQATIIKQVFEVKFNITTQQFIANGDTELTALKLKEFEYSKTARFLGVENDGKIVPLIGIPENTLAMGTLYLNKNIVQAEAIVPSASGVNDCILKIDSKIISAFNNTLYGEIVPYGSDGHTTFRNRYSAGNFKFYIAPSTGAQTVAMDIQAPSGIVKCNFGIAIPYGGGFIEQRADASNHGRFHLFTDAGDTELNNAFNTGKYKLFMSNGTAGGKVQMLQTFASGRTQLQNGGTYTDITSARLAVNSTTEGFLPPRMTTTQKNAIPSPAQGLIVFDITLGKLCVYIGTAWETITSI